MYFVGVTTGASAIHGLFPRWARLAGVSEASLAGIDIALEAPPEHYREAVAKTRDDPESGGALVTTHKIGIFAHARDLFSEFDADAQSLGEVSCIVRRPGRLAGLAVDTLTAGLALRDLIGERPFRGHVLILGAGGAATALAVHLYRAHQPAEVILTDISAARLERVRRLTPARCELVADPEAHDHLLAAMPPGSLIVNATGMGKDRPGSPITPAARFPPSALAWEFNYRGELAFLESARAQGARAADGWSYFLHGWSQIMARALGFELTPELFAAFRAAAS